MRKIFIISLLFLGCVVYGQDTSTVKPDSYHYIFKVSPFLFFNQTFQVGLETPINSSNALLFMPSITYSQVKSGFGFEVQYKYYVINKIEANKTSYNKYYVGLYGMYKNFNYDNITGRNAGGGGIVTGINRVFSKRFHFDLWIGGGIRTSDGVSNNVTDITFRGIAPRFGLDLGINY